MLKMHQKYIRYNLDNHKDYGNKIHLKKLEKFSPSLSYHLSSYPMKKIQDN